MLCELRVKNLALIEFLELGFDQALGAAVPQDLPIHGWGDYR